MCDSSQLRIRKGYQNQAIIMLRYAMNTATTDWEGLDRNSGREHFNTVQGTGET
jgi:hypothetical protein